MLFWIIAVLIALVVALSLALPLWRGDAGGGTLARDQDLYRSQLAEVDRDLARGVLSPDEADRARTEIARRLLAADKAGPARVTAAPAGISRILATLLGAAVVAGSAGTYWFVGAPGYPDLPLQDRLAAAQDRFDNRLPQAEAEARVADTIAAQRITPPDDILASVSQVRADLEAAPDDIAILTLLRDFETGTRNWPAAAAMQARLRAADPDAGPDDLALQIDLMVFATDGYVSAEAKTLLGELATTAPDHPALPWFEGLVYADVGRPDLAFQVWRPLVETGSGIFADRARSLIVQAASDAGVDYALPPGPDAAQVAAADMAPEDQQAMIEGMVNSLAERLATEGGPATDWARLIESYGVLGQVDAASAVWAEAQTVFADSPEGMEVLRAAATRAGVVGVTAP